MVVVTFVTALFCPPTNFVIVTTGAGEDITVPQVIVIEVKVDVGGNIPNRNVLFVIPEPKFQYPFVFVVVNNPDVSAHTKKYPPPEVLAELMRSKIFVPPNVIVPLHATLPEVVTELQLTLVAVIPD
jgi:hypothetical protein